MRILDATCSRRAMWYDKHESHTTYIDIRQEVHPDIVCDCTATPFSDKTFDLIVFDPPHKDSGPGLIFYKRYGTIKRKDIPLLITQSFCEFHRILTDEGIVLFKWNSHEVKLNDVLYYTRYWFTPLFGQQVSLRTKHSSQTYWVTLIKNGRRLEYES
jgi:tRNA G10  N-methylase Trm11